MRVYIDIDRCIGCRSCEVACQRIHDGKGHMNVQIVDDYASVPIFCHHCEDAACTMVCFNKALSKDEDRTTFNMENCTGCGLCQLACPFGVVWTDKLAHKCDLCPDREIPICTQTCPANALATDFEVLSKRARDRAILALAKGGRK